ncbi:hypothetical protein GCM10020000_55360 [Streptomyces olivoverticillatus]
MLRLVDGRGLVQHAQSRDALTIRVHCHVIATGMTDGGGNAVARALDADAHAVAVVQAVQRQLDRAWGLGRDRAAEGADYALLRVGDRQDAVRSAVPLQGPARALHRKDRLAGLWHGVHQSHAVGGREDDALGVELYALVEGGGPGGAEPAARAVRGQVRALEDERQGARQGDVGLRQQHDPGRDVDRVLGALKARRWPGHGRHLDEIGAQAAPEQTAISACQLGVLGERPPMPRVRPPKPAP